MFQLLHEVRSMNGFIKIRVMAGGKYADCWQQVVDGVVVGHVDDAGVALQLPEPCETMVVGHEGSRELHFAPCVLRDPAADVVAQLPLE